MLEVNLKKEYKEDGNPPSNKETTCQLSNERERRAHVYPKD